MPEYVADKGAIRILAKDAQWISWGGNRGRGSIYEEFRPEPA